MLLSCCYEQKAIVSASVSLTVPMNQSMDSDALVVGRGLRFGDYGNMEHQPHQPLSTFEDSLETASVQINGQHNNHHHDSYADYDSDTEEENSSVKKPWMSSLFKGTPERLRRSDVDDGSE